MFQKTRLKLTAWYLLILMTVTLFFSLTIHAMLIRQVRGFVLEQRFRIERRFGPIQPPEPWDNNFLNDANRRITFSLVVINAVIFIVGGTLSYFLAGKTLKPIKQMLDKQNRFITDSSHELRTPLTSLKLAMEVALRNKSLTLKQAKDLISENILEVNRLQNLSNRLLRLSSSQSPAQGVPKEDIVLSEVIANAIKNVSGQASVKKITIKNLVHTDKLILGRAEDLTELFSILLDNAIKYSPEKSRVTLVSKDGQQNIRVSVKDHGVGINKKDLLHIFDRFYRGDVARSKEGNGGFGLGLSIAKKFAEEHGGDITVKSKVGIGSTFTVHLPS